MLADSSLVCHGPRLLGKEARVGGAVTALALLLPVIISLATLVVRDYSRLFFLCLGSEEQFFYDLTDFTVRPERGLFFKLPIIHPFRIAYNITGWILPCLLPPVLYYKIFKFRKRHDHNLRGLNQIKTNRLEICCATSSCNNPLYTLTF